MLEIGKTYRLTQTPNYVDPILDGIPNYNYITHVDNFPCFAPRRGINTFQTVTDRNGDSRMPIIILHSSPNNSTRNYNPWHDELYPNRGIIKYYGDNLPNANPNAVNNPYLLKQVEINHSDQNTRFRESIPIVCMQTASSGYHVFQGFGIVESAKLVTQYSERDQKYYPNYLFIICVFSLANENEVFDWQWIADRCNPELTIHESNRRAPSSWKYWIQNGIEKLHKIRRNVFSGKIVPKEEQLPTIHSKTEETLKAIYQYYTSRNAKHDFEALAIDVTKKIIEENGGNCTPGWLTPQSNDGGYDFVLGLNIGAEPLSVLKIVIIGQAKCEQLSGTVNGKDIARLVARLKHGWIGAFVTTQTFTAHVQKEVLEDKYPLMLINGKKIAEVVMRGFQESPHDNLPDYLDSITNAYIRSNNAPEDIMI